MAMMIDAICGAPNTSRHISAYLPQIVKAGAAAVDTADTMRLTRRLVGIVTESGCDQYSRSFAIAMLEGLAEHTDHAPVAIQVMTETPALARTAESSPFWKVKMDTQRLLAKIAPQPTAPGGNAAPAAPIPGPTVR